MLLIIFLSCLLGNSIILLEILFYILICGEITVKEPNTIILIIEILLEFLAICSIPYILYRSTKR